MKISVGSDHAGFAAKQAIAQRMRDLGHEVTDHGCDSEESVDYPDFGAAVARSVAAGATELGICVCGTGIGIAMSANKVAGVRAATVHDKYTAEMSREHNDANVLCLGARVLDPGPAVEIAEYWITVPFGEGRHSGRVAKINALDDARAGT
jgi:ribose 5-phosphate isomerase B